MKNNKKKSKLLNMKLFMDLMKLFNTCTKFFYYAIHSGDAELNKYLEDNQISPPNDTYESILRESIKCHHNNVSKYIINYLVEEKELKNNIENKFSDNLYRYSFEYHNYCFFPTNIKYKYIFYYLCELDYYTLVELYLELESIDINATIISTIYIF